MVGHVAPEAALGGPIAALRERDIISIDLRTRSVSVELDRATARKAAVRLASPNSALCRGGLRQVCGPCFFRAGRRSHPAGIETE